MNKEYEELKNKLIAANNEYYVNSNPILSDYMFDMELDKLRKMEEEQGFADPDSPTQKPGSDLSANTKNSNKHRNPMLSLENTYNADDVEKWYSDMQKAAGRQDVMVCVQPKFDGGSAAITFKNGKVVKALTRGDGLVGEDITENVKLLDWSKIKKTFSGEVRGELIITKKGFEVLNQEGKYQNARNLLSGSMKLLDQSEFKLRAPYIKFYAYWFEDSKNKTYSEDMTELMSMNGFNGPAVSSNAKSLEELLKELNVFEKLKDSFDYAIDGAVMKVNDKSLWKKLGSTAKFPRWAKAFKFKQENAETTITNITFEVGRSGKITPLAWFEPVFIDGSLIQKATLNNKEFYDAMDVAIGDIVSVQKAAAIIPQIIGVEHSPNRKEVPFPKVCPSCGTVLVKHNEEHSDLFCDNPNCECRIIDGIVNYTHSLEIDGFAEIIVKKLYDAGILKGISDLYHLEEHKDEISKIERLSMNMAEKLISNVNNAKSVEFWKTLAGLGIPNIGPKMAKTLAKEFKDIDSLENASLSQLMDVPDVAKITAESIIQWFDEDRNKKLIQALKDAGQNLKTADSEEKKNKFEGKTFCITGALSKPRSEFVSLIESLGGKVSSSVSKKTSYLMTNDTTSGSKKNVAAQEFGIPIINEDDFEKMLKN